MPYSVHFFFIILCNHYAVINKTHGQYIIIRTPGTSNFWKFPLIKVAKLLNFCVQFKQYFGTRMSTIRLSKS